MTICILMLSGFIVFPEYSKEEQGIIFRNNSHGPSILTKEENHEFPNVSTITEAIHTHTTIVLGIFSNFMDFKSRKLNSLSSTLQQKVNFLHVTAQTHQIQRHKFKKKNCVNYQEEQRLMKHINNHIKSHQLQETNIGKSYGIYMLVFKKIHTKTNNNVLYSNQTGLGSQLAKKAYEKSNL